MLRFARNDEPFSRCGFASLSLRGAKATKQSRAALQTGLLRFARNDEPFSRRVRARVMPCHERKTSLKDEGRRSAGRRMSWSRATRVRCCHLIALSGAAARPAGRARLSALHRGIRQALTPDSTPGRASWNYRVQTGGPSPAPVQRAPRRPVVMPVGSMPGAARERFARPRAGTALAVAKRMASGMHPSRASSLLCNHIGDISQERVTITVT